jgi:hypothetical protein
MATIVLNPTKYTSANPDRFSQQVRTVIVGALALGLGLAYNTCIGFGFVLHDKTETVSVYQQFLSLVLYALLFTLVVFAVLTIWDQEYSNVKPF